MAVIVRSAVETDVTVTPKLVVVVNVIGYEDILDEELALKWQLE